MNPLLYILPLCIAYTLVRAYMHYRAGRKMWVIQMSIFAAFLTAVLAYEVWVSYFSGQ